MNRLTDNITDVPWPTFLEFGQNIGLKSQRGHTEEEIPDAISWNRNKMGERVLVRQTEDRNRKRKRKGMKGWWPWESDDGRFVHVNVCFHSTWLCRHSPVLRLDFLRESDGFLLNLSQLIRRLKREITKGRVNGSREVGGEVMKPGKGFGPLVTIKSGSS